MYRPESEMRVKSFGTVDIYPVTSINNDELVRKRFNVVWILTLVSTYPVIWIDAVCKKIRIDNNMCPFGIIDAIGINTEVKFKSLLLKPWNINYWYIASFFRKTLKASFKLCKSVFSDTLKGIQVSLRTTFTVLP